MYVWVVYSNIHRCDIRSFKNYLQYNSNQKENGMGRRNERLLRVICGFRSEMAKQMGLLQDEMAQCNWQMTSLRDEMARLRDDVSSLSTVTSSVQNKLNLVERRLDTVRSLTYPTFTRPPQLYGTINGSVSDPKRVRAGYAG